MEASSQPLTRDCSLYIHLPWCLHKCPYCDFNSHATDADTFPERRYVDSLILDLQQSCARLGKRKITSIFIGGGTPSLFSPASIDRILTACKQTVSLAVDCEITLETNPGTFEYQKFSEFLACGVNRLSVGVQSFNQDYLQILQRIHTGKEAITAIEVAQNIGFKNINVDLMFGLPEQTLPSAAADIAQACALQVEHISYYQLTLEPNTTFHRYPPKHLPDPDQCWKFQLRAIEQLDQAGYQRYEVSAYAQPERQCRHNLNYWIFGDYLGIGAGAHSKLSCTDTVVRNQRKRQPGSYMQSVASGEHIVQSRTLRQDDLVFEFLLNNLRLADGFQLAAFAKYTGLPQPLLERRLAQGFADQMLEMQQQRIRATERGYRFLDELLQQFLPSSA